VLAVNSKGARGAYVGASIVPLNSSASQVPSSAAGAVGGEYKVLPRPKPTVFASLYPTDADSFDDLRCAVALLASSAFGG
jgi:translation elongation factor EF-4